MSATSLEIKVKQSGAYTLPSGGSISFSLSVDSGYNYAISGGFQINPSTDNVMWSCYPSTTSNPTQWNFTAANITTASNYVVYGYIIELQDSSSNFSVSVNTASSSATNLFKSTICSVPSGYTLCGGGFQITSSSTVQHGIYSSYPNLDQSSWICSMNPYGTNVPNDTLTVYAVGIKYVGTSGYNFSNRVAVNQTDDFSGTPSISYFYGTALCCGGGSIYTENYDALFLSSSYPTDNRTWGVVAHQEGTTAGATLTAYGMNLSLG